MTAKQLYFSHVRKNALFYFLGFLAMLATSLSEVLTPKFIEWFIDGVTNASSTTPSYLNDLLVGMFLVFCLGVIGRVGWRQFLARQTHLAGYMLKTKFWQALSHQGLHTFHRYSLGDLVNRATGDWNASRFIFGFTIILSFDVIFFTIMALVAMLLIDPWLTLASLAVFPLLPPLIRKLADQERKDHEVAQEHLGHLSDLAAQAVQTIRMQRATHSHQVWFEKLSAAASEYADKYYQVRLTAWKMFPVGTGPTLIAYGILFVLGLPKLTAGSLTVGEFIAMQSYIILLQAPLFELGDCIAEWQRGRTSLSRVAEIIALPAPGQVHADLPAGEMLRILDVSFSYKGETRKVLDHISLDVSPGEWVGITGAIGSGKSTLLKVIAGLHPATAGSVHYGDFDVSKGSRDSLVKVIQLIPQNAFIFAGTIRENLNLDGAYTEDELWQALDLACLREDVESFSLRLDTVIGEWGINLSGGQRQRLALARAVLRPSSIYLLDDVLSAVDTVTESKIVENFSRMMSGKTLIWVAHRSSTLRHCHKVYHMAEGRLR